MKVEQYEIPEFKPITLIIETQKEADALWYLLNLPIKQTAEIVKSNPEITNSMWKALDNVYRPEDS